MVGIDNKKAFDIVPHEWILKIQNIFDISPVITLFQKYKTAKWHTDLRLIHEKGILKTNQNINNEIFQGAHFPLFLYSSNTSLHRT